jgi:HK97 family phage major capsid protein
MKDFIKKLIAKKEARAQELRTLIQNCEDVNEARNAMTELETVNGELTEARGKLAEIEADEARKAQGNGAGFNPIATYGQNGAQTRATETVDKFDTPEYRKAFMEFVCRGTAIPAEYRATTTTADVGAVIPTTMANEIIKELKAYGNIYSQVRKLNVQGGVEIPILSLKPTATWIGETTPSEEQKLEMKSKITFSYFGLECRIAQTLLASIVTLDMFQREFVPLAVEAITVALEVAILNGDGSGKPLGITKDSRVPSANVITLSGEDFASWSAWKKKVFAKMKKKYRNGTFFMAQGTFDGYIDGMVDSNGQPIGRVNYGITDGEAYRFGGKAVETVEDDIIANYDSAATGDVVAVFVKLSDYAINSNMQMTTVKWIDHDTNEVKNKVMLIVDGKLVDPNGVLIIKKGAAKTE